MPENANFPDLMQRANECVDRGALEEARDLFLRACETDAGKAEAWLMCGVIAAETGAFGPGIQLIEKAASIAPRDGHVLLTLAHALLSAGRIEEAESAARRATLHSSGDIETWILLGGLCGQLGRFDESVEANRKALELDSHNVAANVNLAGALHRLGQVAEAEIAYRRALSSGADQPEVSCNLAGLLVEAGRYDEAEALLGTLAKATPERGDVHLLLGAMHGARGDLEGAIQSYERAANLMPGNPDPSMRLAKALLDAGREDEARAAYERAVALGGGAN